MKITSARHRDSDGQRGKWRISRRCSELKLTHRRPQVHSASDQENLHLRLPLLQAGDPARLRPPSRSPPLPAPTKQLVVVPST